MDPVLKQAWVDDLRNGGFEQTAGVLHDENGYCCLGVLCETVQRTDFVALETKDNDNYSTVKDGAFYVSYRLLGDDDGYEREWNDGEFDESMRVALGLSNDEQKTLVEMNDDQKSSFTEIADWIEGNL